MSNTSSAGQPGSGVARSIILEPGGGRSLVMGPDDERITFKAVGEDTAGMLAFVEYQIPPGSTGTTLHSHDGHEEGFYVLDGVLHMQLGDAVLAARPGAFVFVPRNVAHAFWNAGRERCRFVATFTPPGFERLFEDQVALLGRDTPPDRTELDELARRHGIRVLGPSPAHGRAGRGRQEQD
jgi:quercetin dioxygenase-like cupin family protein